MPIKQCYLPGGGTGFQWGNHGHCYPTREEAQKQAEAAYAHGYAGDMALDASVRSKDVDGRMHVAVSNISKANVCPYRGSEIVDYEALGLDPDRIYNLLRDPDALEAATDSFNNIPIIIVHKPSVATDHPREITVGTTGGEAEYVAPYMRNSLIIWDQEGIDLIESKEQCELSPGYRYVADMVPGDFNGVKYDGRMIDIKANHLALVKVGRTGPDVFVFDKLPLELSKMKVTRKAKAFASGIAAYLKPRLAADAAIDAKALGALIAKTNMDRPKIAAAVVELYKPKLAQDADLSDIAEVIEAIAPVIEQVEEENPAVVLDEPGDQYAQLVAKLKAMCTPEQLAELQLDADPEAPHGPEGGAQQPSGEPVNITKQAMDSAVKLATDSAYERAMADSAAIRAAEKEVAPLIGEIAPQKSAADVYRLALDAASVPHADVKEVVALRALAQLAVANKTAAVTPATKTSFAADGASARADILKRVPNFKTAKVA